MKYIKILYIALGLVSSLAIGIEYDCKGQEVFPIYYGSPFVFKQTSLGSSMQYYYSVSGLLLNVLIWGFVLLLINTFVLTLIKKTSAPKWIYIVYRKIGVLLLVFSTLNIILDLMMIGRGFDKSLNYWYWDLNTEAKSWGVVCEGEVIFFSK